MNIGAVAAMQNVKHAIAVARLVLENTKHTLLVGERATEFALQMGFENESLTTSKSRDMWAKWKSANCQPNFWMVKNASFVCETRKFRFDRFVCYAAECGSRSYENVWPIRTNQIE